MIEDDLVDKVDKVETEKEVDVCLLDFTEEVGFIAPESVPDLVLITKDDATKENNAEKDEIKIEFLDLDGLITEEIAKISDILDIKQLDIKTVTEHPETDEIVKKEDKGKMTPITCVMKMKTRS